MAVVVQKQAGTLSTLVSGNQFYETVYEGNMFPDNQGASTTGYDSVTSTDKYINFTPTKAGNIKGVILALYNTYFGGIYARGKTIRIRLEENVSGTWTTRLTETFHTDKYIKDNKWSRCRGLIDVRFSSTYAITTASNTWRFNIDAITVGGTVDSGTMYLLFSQNGSNWDNMFFIPYIDSTVSLTSSDTLILTDKITLDDNLTLAGKHVVTGSQSNLNNWNRYYAIYTCMNIVESGSETTPQIYVPSTVGGNYKIDLDGSWFISTDNEALLVGEDSDNPIPYNWSDRTDTSNRTFELLFSRQGTRQQTGFIAVSSIAGSRYGNGGGFSMYGEIPNRISADFYSDASSGQNKIVLKGDVTDYWAVGDNLMIGGSQYSATRSYRDYVYNEYRQITALAYDSGTDATTVTLNTNLAYNHLLLADDENVPTKVTLVNRNIVFGGTSTTYTVESHSSGNGLWFKIHGVRLHDIQYIYSRYNLLKYHSPEQRLKNGMEIIGCDIQDSYYPLNIYSFYLGVEVRGNTSSSLLTGTTIRNMFPVRFVSCSYVEVYDNIFLGRNNAGVYLSSGNNNIVKNNYVSAQYGIQISGATTFNEVEDNTLVRCRCGIYFSSGNFNTFKNNTFRRIYYDSAYSNSAETVHGCYYSYANYSNIQNLAIGDDADYGHAFVVSAENTFGTFIFKDTKLGTNWNDQVVNESAINFRSSWVAGSEYKFENYNEKAGLCRAWYTNGYIESCGTGLDDTISHTAGEGKKAWRLNPYYTDREHALEFTIPIGVPNEPITLSIFCKIKSLNYASGTYKPPMFSISGLGVSGVSTECTADVTTTDWQLLVVSGSPTEAGQLNVKLSIETDEITTNIFTGFNSDGSVYWDDLYVAYKTPLDLGTLDLVSGGLPIFPPLTVVMTASSVWAEQLSANDVSGSFGEAVGLLKKWVGWLRSLL